jgi:hypothetical protein
VFLAEINGLEVVRDNQKISELSTSFTPSAIDVHDSLVAVGGEVFAFFLSAPGKRLTLRVHRMRRSDYTHGTESR